jgi:excisionase family DNA binding protein
MKKTDTEKCGVRSGTLDLHEVLRDRKTAWRVPELARLLSLGARTVYDAVDSGQLRAMKIGTAVRINPKDALTWIETSTYGGERTSE